MRQDSARRAGIEGISRSMGRLRVLIGRRVISRLALRNVAPMLDISDLDVLGLVPPRPDAPARPALPGAGRTDARGADPAAAEVCVGDIARQLRIDPSRASRLVAELVQRGFLIRAVSQQDARRAVLQRSDSGERVLAEIQRVKYGLIRDIAGDWSEERLAAFAADFDSFTRALDERLSRPDHGRDRPSSGDGDGDGGGGS